MPAAKPEARREARLLREKGMSVRRIAALLNVSQGSVSTWVRDIPLTTAQRQELDGAAAASRQRFAETYGGKQGQGGRNRQEKIERIERLRQEATQEFPNLVSSAVFVYGLGLYAGEGNKTEESFRLSNSDPRIVRACSAFVSFVSPESEYTLSARLHHHASVSAAIAFWKAQIPAASAVTARIYRDMRPGAGRLLRGGFRSHGVCTLYVRKSSSLFHKTMRWIEMIENGEVA